MRTPFRLPFTKQQVERDVDRELATHLELRAEALVRKGMTLEEARREAVRLFGDSEAARAACLRIDLPEHTKAVRRNALDELRMDVAFAARSLRRNPAVTLLMIVILAIGIGATTAVFSLYETVVLSPVRTGDASRLVWIENVRADASDHDVTTGAYFAWRDGAQTLAHFGTLGTQSATLVGNGIPARLEGATVGDGLLTALETRAELGRVFNARDYETGSAPVVMLSRALWLGRFRGDSSIVGRTITLDDVARTVVGIMPPSADLFDDGTQFWIPSRLNAGGRANFVTPRLQLVGQLKPGVSVAAAEKELASILLAADTRPDRASAPVTVRVTKLAEQLGSAFRSRLLLVFAAVACVLAVGCMNVASLLVARGIARQRELAVRASLGASTARIVRQLLTEYVLLALVAGVAGLACGYVTLAALKAALPSGLPHLALATIDTHAALFALGTTLVCCVMVGLIPAWRVARVDVRTTLQSGTRGAVGGGERLRRVLITAEVCMATLLLVTAGLLVRSASALDRVPLGFGADDVLAARVSLPYERYAKPSNIIAANTRLLEELRTANGGAPAAIVSRIPLVSLGISYDFAPSDRTGDADRTVNAAIVLSSPDYFRTMRMRLTEGRDFTDRDLRTSPRVAIVNAAMARRLQLGSRAIGARITGLGNSFNDTTSTAAPWEIVGVVADTRDWGSRNETRPQVYLPLTQTPDEVWDWTNRTTILVAQGPSASATLARMRTAVARVDATLPLYDVEPMIERVRASNQTERGYSALLTVLGGAALLLAAAGIYAMLAYAVRQRVPEIGVRMALGATPANIVGLIVRWVLGVTTVGIALGLALSVSFTRLLNTLLFGVTRADPATLAGAALLMVLTALVTCVAPARRALAISPNSALRADG